MTNTDILKKQMLEALEKSLGVVTSACKSVGVSRQTHYVWMKADEQYRDAVNDIGEIAVDFAESQLHQQIKDGNQVSTIFYLKTKGKHRGYVERIEQDNKHQISEYKGWADRWLLDSPESKSE